MPHALPDDFSSCPLLMTADAQLLDELLRLAAAAGAQAQVAPDIDIARSLWQAPPLVLVGSDLARSAAQAGLPRRSGVVLVGSDLDDATVWDTAVAIGADSVVFLPDARAWLVDRFAGSVERDAAGCAIAVVGGRGGAGATTLAVALAVTAARQSLRCMLVDGDPLGGGIDLALGGEDTVGLRWPQLSAMGGRVSSKALWAALPDFHSLGVLSCDRGDFLSLPPPAMTSVLRAGRRSSDLVVVDLPRRLDAAAEVAVADADLSLLVVPAEVRAAAAAARVAAILRPLATDLRVVVRGPAPGGLSGRSVADALGLRYEGWLAPETGLAEAMDRGEPPARSGKGPLAQFCGKLLAGIAPTGLATA